MMLATRPPYPRGGGILKQSLLCYDAPVTGQSYLDRISSKLLSQWPQAGLVLEHAKVAGLKLTRLEPIRESDKSSWALWMKPSQKMVQRFGLSPELMVLYSPWPELRVADIRSVEELAQTEARVDPGFVVVLAKDLDAKQRVLHNIPSSRAYLFISEDEWCKHDPERLLDHHLREGLGTRRLFEPGSPVKGDHFFGRAEELECLDRATRTGRSVGLYGLRKVGKTSLLLRFVSRHQNVAGKTPPLLAMMDLQAVPFQRRNFHGVMKVLAESLHKADEQAFPDADPNRIDDRLTAVLTKDRRIVLILDEYERLVTDRARIEGGVNVLEWLRGRAQGSEGALTFVLAGRDDRPIRQARFDGRDNPVYRFLQKMPVRGLDRADCNQMMTSLGSRQLLRFSASTLDTVYRYSGGHPLLARTLGDLIDRRVSPKDRPFEVDKIIGEVLQTFREDTDEDMRELWMAAQDIDDRATEWLRELVFDGFQPPQDAWARNLQKGLIDYGILERNGTFRISLFEAWLRTNFEPFRKLTGND